MPTLTELTALDAGTKHRCDIYATVTLDLIEETNDVDEPTRQLCEKCPTLCSLLRSNSLASPLASSTSLDRPQVDLTSVAA